MDQTSTVPSLGQCSYGDSETDSSGLPNATSQPRTEVALLLNAAAFQKE